MLRAKPRVNDVLRDGSGKRWVVTSLGEGGDANLCWIVDEGMRGAVKSQPFIWRFKEGLNTWFSLVEDANA